MLQKILDDLNASSNIINFKHKAQLALQNYIPRVFIKLL